MMALNATHHGWYYTAGTAPGPVVLDLRRADPVPVLLEIYSRAADLGCTRASHWYQLVPRRHRSDVTTASQFFTRPVLGHPAAVSFVRPGFGYSEETAGGHRRGRRLLGQLVQAVARSRYWDSTAIFLDL